MDVGLLFDSDGVFSRLYRFSPLPPTVYRPTRNTPFLYFKRTTDLSQLPPVFRDFRDRIETNRTSETKQAKQTLQYYYNIISRSPEKFFTINGLSPSLPLLLQKHQARYLQDGEPTYHRTSQSPFLEPIGPPLVFNCGDLILLFTLLWHFEM